MNTRPIIFSGPSVPAIFNGTKTETRRVVRPRFAHQAGSLEITRYGIEAVASRTGCMAVVPSPYGAKGDRLWVRETFGVIDLMLKPEVSLEAIENGDDVWMYGGTVTAEKVPAEHIIYRADHDPSTLAGAWRPPIHMPRWASRLTLQVESVRVERVQDITNDSATAEGCPGYSGPGVAPDYVPDAMTPREEFRELWDQINGRRTVKNPATGVTRWCDAFSWANNPWVWVVAFRRVAA